MVLNPPCGFKGVLRITKVPLIIVRQWTVWLCEVKIGQSLERLRPFYRIDKKTCLMDSCTG